MHYPEGSPGKKAKKPSPLEIELEKLKETIDELQPLWKKYDPGFFMDQMLHMGKRVDRLTPSMVEQFIARGQHSRFFTTLDALESELLGATLPTSSQPLERTDSDQRARNDMIAYLRGVHQCLKGQSRHTYCVVTDSRSEDLVARAQAKPSPRDFAVSSVWRVYQEKADAILCRRPADRRGWPVPLMHMAFCDFYRHFHEPCLDKRIVKYLVMADKLCQIMPSSFSSEPARRDAFERIFRSLDEGLTPHVECHLSVDNSFSRVREPGGRSDMAKTIPYKRGALVLMLEEFKNEAGDAYMQICRAYEILCGDPKVEHLVKCGNPVFLLCVIGMCRTFITNHTF
jgi:hypothetical protein